MDKHRKLKKYQRKDYSQTVDFPVEIVGRDGVVRTYSFEDSIRLYQRRITSAAMRYSDKDIVDAEVGHCRRRIDQLRRSYFERYSWNGIRMLEATGGMAREFAGEIAAFLRRHGVRWFAQTETIEFNYLDSGERFQVFSLRSSLEPDKAYLLYLYRFSSQRLATAARKQHPNASLETLLRESLKLR